MNYFRHVLWNVSWWWLRLDRIDTFMQFGNWLFINKMRKREKLKINHTFRNFNLFIWKVFQQKVLPYQHCSLPIFWPNNSFVIALRSKFIFNHWSFDLPFDQIISLFWKNVLASCWQSLKIKYRLQWQDSLRFVRAIMRLWESPFVIGSSGIFEDQILCFQSINSD